MKITVRRKLNENENEEYGFNLFDLTAVFVNYHREIKPMGKRKFIITDFWDKYSRQSNLEEPTLPPYIKLEALEEVKKYISIKTWAEYKS